MGAYDSAEVCDLIGLYLLDSIGRRFPLLDFGLYRDDGLAASKDMDGHTLDKFRKELVKAFKEWGLGITIDTNLTTADFLDVNLDLATGLYKPFSKPNDKLTYIHKNSCYPQVTFKNLVNNISRNISSLSSNRDIFNRPAPYYNTAPEARGHKEKIEYIDKPQQTHTHNRKRKTLWFAPPFSLNVLTNIGGKFLALVDKHFPAEHRYRKIFNRGNLKASYCAMPNMHTVISRAATHTPRTRTHHVTAERQ